METNEKTSMDENLNQMNPNISVKTCYHVS